MIIPDKIHPTYVDNLLGGLAMHLAGPEFLRLGFHVFVVVVGVLILSGATNASIIGANSVMNRVAEDGVLLPWFRKLYAKFGTTYRIINLVAMLQVVTIVLGGGNIYLLGEAYAFGVVWSFFLKALGVLVLRYHRHDQGYKFPGNITIRGSELPIGLAMTTLLLGSTAVANLFPKKFATICGIIFTVLLFVIFTVSEHINRRRKDHHESGLEEFKIETSMPSSRPGAILVAAREMSSLAHLESVLRKTNLRRHDIIVMTVRPPTTTDQVFTSYGKELFSKVVSMAEKEGKTVELLVVPGADPFGAIMQTAQTLQMSRVVTGASLRMETAELARRIGMAWEKLPEPRHAFSLEILTPDRPSHFVNLGPHPPHLWPEDVERAHQIWLGLSTQLGSKLHHRDVVGAALERLQRELEDPERAAAALQDVKDSLSTPQAII